MNRRSFTTVLPFFAGVYSTDRNFLLGDAKETITRSDVDRLLDTKDSERHCGESHNHRDRRFDDWEGSLRWSASDCGHNEGAGVVIKLAVSNGLRYPDIVYGCAASERLVPRIDEAMKDPDTLDQYLGLASASQIAAIKTMLKQRKNFAEILATLSADRAEIIGEVWRRRAMLRFASVLTYAGSITPAVAIATASQWHNCHAFECLLRHPNEVVRWLQMHTATQSR